VRFSFTRFFVDDDAAKVTQTLMSNGDSGEERSSPSASTVTPHRIGGLTE
jgi:hypothetical protein